MLEIVLEDLAVMPFRNILSRPSTSASSNKRHSFLESSHDGNQASPSTDRGHKKIGSLQRLSLSFVPSRDGVFFPQFVTDSPQSQSRNNSVHTEGLLTEVTSNVSASNGQTESGQIAILKDGTESSNTADYGATLKPSRFSLMKFRHSSEPQLSTRYRQEETHGDEFAVMTEDPPQIVTTAPTGHAELNMPPTVTRRDRFMTRAFSTFRRSQIIRDPVPIESDTLSSTQRDGSLTISAPDLLRTQSDIQYSTRRDDAVDAQFPPAYGDHSSSALAIPMSRLSESNGSEGSNSSHRVYAQTTTTHLISTTTTFFKIKRDRERKQKRSKDKGPLFPLPERIPPPAGSSTARTSMSNNDDSQASAHKPVSPSRRSIQAVRWNSNVSDRHATASSPMQSVTALTNAPLGSPGPVLTHRHSTMSNHSGTSTPSSTLIPPRLGARGRSSTFGSLGKSERFTEEPSQAGTARTSTSTAGRKSFGDILSLPQRLRQNSAPPRNNNGGSGAGSNPNSLHIAREQEPELVYPKRSEEDTPSSYLEKLEAAVPRTVMATVLCKGDDEFSKTCLRKYMRGFSYFGESIDISIRKMLMEVVLPKETQQIDRLLAGFADRYHECNPGIFLSADEANFVAFSILLLQSDNHNKNNKRKMTKEDYIKNTQNGKISVCEDVLECFYDNICYTPFIHFEDEVAINSHRLAAPKAKKSLIKSRSSENLRGPVDPYTLILDNKIDVLRPPLKEVMDTEEPYAAPGSTESNSIADHHKAFTNSAILQIVSARSRPDAFANQATITNPAEAQAGIVSIKVAKVGLLWRKSAKKKKAKSPWQEWGCILTDSKLYFFKDISWMRKLISQYEGHHKSSTRPVPLVFKPPLPSFDPDALMAMDDAVALIDATYTRHKNAFTFIKHGGFEEVFLANSADDMRDWIGKLNYAATFRTAGVRMRGLPGGNHETPNTVRDDSEASAKRDLAVDEQAIPTGVKKVNSQAAWEIMFYRRQLVSEKISTFDDHVAGAQKELEHLQRNARHLLLLLPIQQKTREALVYAAGLMNAKLQWTRKEIWRVRTHRDILARDLEAETTRAFPAPSLRDSASVQATPIKTGHHLVDRDNTDPPAQLSIGQSPQSIRRRLSQAVLDQITVGKTDVIELSSGRRKSAASHRSLTPSSFRSHHLEEIVSELSLANHAAHRTSFAPEFTLSPTRDRGEGSIWTHGSHPGMEKVDLRSGRRGSDTDVVRHSKPYNLDGSLRERGGSIRRSLQRTLRESSHGTYMPHHHRSRRGRDSTSTVATSDDGLRSGTSGDSEELRRDPTGRFVLHGKKASVITMGPEWQFSSEDRIKVRDHSAIHGDVLLGHDREAALPKAFPRANAPRELCGGAAPRPSEVDRSDRPTTAATESTTSATDDHEERRQSYVSAQETQMPRRSDADHVPTPVTAPSQMGASPSLADIQDKEGGDIEGESDTAIRAAKALSQHEGDKLIAQSSM